MAELQRIRVDSRKISPYDKIPDFPKGCEVVLTLPNPDRFYEGTLRWIGSYNNMFYAVVQLSEVVEGGTDGTFHIENEDVQLAECPRGTAHWAQLGRVSIPPKNLKIGDNCRLRGTETRGTIKWMSDRKLGILLTNSTEGPNGFFKNKKRFECGPNQGSCFCERKDIEYLGPAAESEYQPQSKLDLNNLDNLCGRNRGIQGENISSYLDTLLFVFFAFSTHLQKKIGKQKNLSKEQKNAKKVLLEKIVFPLRKNFFVSASNVMEFRTLFVSLTKNENYIGHRRDFFECLDDFLQIVFGIDSLVDVVYEEHREMKMLHLQIFCQHAYETTYAWIDELFHESSTVNGYLLKDTPAFLILNLMRYERRGKEGTFSCVIPCMELELKDRLLNQRGNPALFTTLQPGAAAPNATTDRRSATMIAGNYTRGTRLVLSAIVCFERSHYDCFARCGRISAECRELKNCRWVHFSSLADRENVANIAEIQQVPVYEWIEYAREHSQTDSKIEDILMPGMSQEWHGLAVRLFDRSCAFVFENY